MELEKNATSSIKDMEIWIKHVVEKTERSLEQQDQGECFVEKIRQYIMAHLDEDDMSRQTIANHLHFSPDYLDRVFKKETEASISDYIFQTRMKKAEELLVLTNLPVSVIASTVGYSHFSHFSKMFKKSSGHNPSDFRKLFGKSSGT
jgi:two-component system response regulator YesN